MSLIAICLFNIYMDYVVKIALSELSNIGIKIKYRMPDGRVRDGSLAQGEEMVSILMYADDIVIMCEDSTDLQKAMDKLEQTTQDWGLTISINKTKVMALNKNFNLSQPVRIRGEIIEQVDGFTYLGSLFNSEGSCGEEIRRRIGFATGKFFSLKKAVWKQRGLGLKTKLRIYNATVISLLLYGAETWTCDQATYDKLDAFNTKKLRYLLGKSREEISNQSIYKITNSRPISELIRERRMKWAGHVRRMNEQRIPKKILFGEVVNGKRGRGRPALSCERCLKADCESKNVNNWVSMSKNRVEWRNVVTSRTSRSGGARK